MASSSSRHCGSFFIAYVSRTVWFSHAAPGENGARRERERERERERREGGVTGGRDVQQRQRDVALQPGFELELDVQVQSELQPDGLGLGHARYHVGFAEPTTARCGSQGLVVSTSAPPPVRVRRR